MIIKYDMNKKGEFLKQVTIFSHFTNPSQYTTSKMLWFNRTKDTDLFMLFPLRKNNMPC